MTTEKPMQRLEGQIVALTLPTSDIVRRELASIQDFQAIVHKTLIPDHDYGVIPGTGKPTLLKPGAEKLTRLLGLAENYEMLDVIEDYEKPLFAYRVKCILTHLATGNQVAQGLGQCNSQESRYRWRWLWPDDVSQSQRQGLVTRKVRTKQGQVIQYRIPNDDLATQVNTILKMACKRAFVGAVLSAARLTDVFTQDMEDLRGPVEQDDLTHTGEAAQPTGPGEPLAKPLPSKTPREETQPIAPAPAGSVPSQASPSAASPTKPDLSGDEFWKEWRKAGLPTGVDLPYLLSSLTDGQADTIDNVLKMGWTRRELLEAGRKEKP